ncbi:MAG: NAD(P)H-hydrate dehydratase [Bacteroidales bacterium]|nr:NAD(P)H-hydrate dehydratase [Bacteroidales bacterium]
MKILSSKQIKEADEYTIANEPVKSIDLMERAAKSCSEWLADNFKNNYSVKIFCGCGNNGGDGLAIARLLSAKKYKVEVLIVKHSNKFSDNFKINEQRLKKIKAVKVTAVSSKEQLKNFKCEHKCIIIDAIFGSGLSKPVEELAAEVIYIMNKAEAIKIAIDIPSGLFCEDNSKNIYTNIFKAGYTLTFELPKLSFMFPENAEYVGDFVILPIGLSSGFINKAETRNFILTFADIIPNLKKRKKFAHKGNFGHALLLSGSYGKIGAAVLASKACLRTGVGLLTTHIPKCGSKIMQTSVPEAMLDIDENENIISSFIDIAKYSAVGIGPGIGTEKETQSALKLIIQSASWPLIFDADAINIISENKTWLSFLPLNSIFTPHPREFERLCGKPKNEVERQQILRDFTYKYQAYIVLKGAHTSITCPDGNIYYNSTGNPGMATAGSGDILTGMILSLVAQGYSSKQACIIGVYLHGLAGDIAAEENGYESLIAGDIIKNIGMAFKMLK